MSLGGRIFMRTPLSMSRRQLRLKSEAEARRFFHDRDVVRAGGPSETNPVQQSGGGQGQTITRISPLGVQRGTRSTE